MKQATNNVTPIETNTSARLKTGKFNIEIKSTTFPCINLSIKLPTPPALTKTRETRYRNLYRFSALL